MQLDFKYDLIFFVGTDLNFYDSNKKIELGKGLDLRSLIFDFTYASFKDMPGGIIIIGLPIIGEFAASFAIAHNPLLAPLAPIPLSFSIVIGGELTPVKY